MNMDNEPRMQDRSPEGQMFAIESEIKNMMKEYEMAVRNGENQRAQMIADQVGKVEEMKIEIQGGMADMAIRRQMAEGDEVKKGGPLGLGIIDAIRGGVGSAFTDPMSAQNYAMNAMKSRMKQDEPTIREMFEKEFKQARMEGKEIFEFMGKMYNTKTAEEVQGMSRGGEFPDLTGDGQVTQADILKGRGVFSSGSKPLKPKGPGVLRPKPKDRYGQVLKTKPIKGKK